MSTSSLRGLLHLTIYDLDDHNKDDNAYGESTSEMSLIVA